MERAQREFLNFQSTHMGVLEITNLDASNDHPGEPRQPVQKMMLETEHKLRETLKIPQNYRVLYMWGGAVGQFSAVPLNLCSKENPKGDYVDMGFWSKRALTEGKKYCDVHVAATVTTKIPHSSTWDVRRDADFVHICLNETVQGTEFHEDPEWPSDYPPLVADATSTLLSRPVDIARYGIVYASGGKNLPAGMCLVIIREDLLTDREAHPLCPQVFDYRKLGGALMPKASCFQSLPNTPPVFAVYMLGLVLDWIREDFGGDLNQVKRWAHARAEKLYDAVEASRGFYSTDVSRECRSVMNAPFWVNGGDIEMERRFAVEAAAAGLHYCFGHPVTGGVRITMYLGLPEATSDAAIAFMQKFEKENNPNTPAAA
uniref:phosphoserine transaminase n=1 Tax=Chromera velia CCMP2878 TaxID=1169474 RepID=A0A0G4I5I3_9ALVE|eukprot:Cvel_11118.t1-p1 / transcript=Cvel_11118.t1 / gene=Cvel_11118 / organism=Chromera_velia_CCMP2878 / gene_product=Phosphoserine aminotransferase, putative / transcript_product=Phosphoserine aminotransferase, putative / location=Cvel_scaffold688:46331-47751(+) / protein_length=372 / sequence_SO=supercontig / SO=protein_coding / is_pseudo=false